MNVLVAVECTYAVVEAVVAVPVNVIASVLVFAFHVHIYHAVIQTHFLLMVTYWNALMDGDEDGEMMCC